MQLKLSPEAERDLFGIHEFGSLRYGVTRADDYLDDLTRTLAMIERMPLSAREREEVRPPLRVWRHEAHNICYRVEGEAVWVVRILHRTADWRTQL